MTAVRALFPIDNDPAAAGDIRAMADPDAVMSPLPGLVSNPCGLRAPHSFEGVKKLTMANCRSCIFNGLGHAQSPVFEFFHTFFRYGPHYSAPGGAQKL